MFLNIDNYKDNSVHPGSKELYERIGDWHKFPIPFSKEFGWNRWGLMGVLADFVLHYTQGEIIEVGIGESSLYFTRLARKYKRKVFHVDVQRTDYENLFTVPDFFDNSNTMYVGTSDQFFSDIKFPPIALGFIDGDHMYEQVEKDFNNLFNLLVDNGYIFFHDLHPPDEANTVETRSGDGYIFRKELELRSDLDIITFPTSAWNAGLTIVRKIPRDAPSYQENGRKIL